MKLPAIFLSLTCATASLAAEPPSAGTEGLASYTFKPRIEDYYPSASRSLNEQGTTTLKFCYDDRGMPRQVVVHRGSGFPKLDEAALLWGKAVRVRPRLSAGEPLGGCALIPVRFSLDKSGATQGDAEEFLSPLVEVPPVFHAIPLPPPPPPGKFIPPDNTD